MKPKKIIAYRIIEDYRPDMEIVVMELIGQGWELFGGAYPLGTVKDWYAQTLVKYDREPK